MSEQLTPKNIFAVRLKTKAGSYVTTFHSDIDAAIQELDVLSHTNPPRDLRFDGYSLNDGPEGLALWLNKQLKE